LPNTRRNRSRRGNALRAELIKGLDCRSRQRRGWIFRSGQCAAGTEASLEGGEPDGNPAGSPVWSLGARITTFRCELGRRQPVFVRIASRESCPNAQVFVDGGASDARW